MGDGRNSLYLSKLGWEVHGFDISEAGVNAARKRAAELKLKIDAAVSSDSEYDFGRGFTGRNGMLRLFDDLVIERYEVTQAVSDFSDRRETEVFRLIARK
jgi:hypothetical protein